MLKNDLLSPEWHFKMILRGDYDSVRKDPKQTQVFLIDSPFQISDITNDEMHIITKLVSKCGVTKFELRDRDAWDKMPWIRCIHLNEMVTKLK